MNLADRLAAARNQRRIEAGLPPLPGFEATTRSFGETSESLNAASPPLPDATERTPPVDGPASLDPSQLGDLDSGDSMAEVIDLTSRKVDPPVIDLRTDPGDGYDLTDPNAVLSWHWEPRDYAVEPPPTHGSAWATFDESRRQLSGADGEDDIVLPNNSTWAERYQQLRRRQHTRPT